MWNLRVTMKFGRKFTTNGKLPYVLCLSKLDNVIVAMNNKIIKHDVFVHFACIKETERAQRVFRDRNNPLNNLNDRKIIERYRLPTNLKEVADLLTDDMERPTSKSKTTSAVIQVGII